MRFNNQKLNILMLAGIIAMLAGIVVYIVTKHQGPITSLLIILISLLVIQFVSRDRKR